MSIKKDHTLFGTKAKNLTTNEICIVIYTWVNKFADRDIDFATCVDENGKRYNIALDDLQVIEG